MELLFDAVHDLYVKAGARNFLFIDVPPINRSPGGKTTQQQEIYTTELTFSYTLASLIESDISERYERWNELLLTQAEEFAESSKKATVLVFSSHDVLSDVLDKPEEYGFQKSDVNEAGEGIWEDQLHLTSAVHHILAEQIHSTIVAQDKGVR